MKNLTENCTVEEAEGIRSAAGCPALERHGCAACRLCPSEYCFGDHLLAIRAETEELEATLADKELTLSEDERAAIGRKLGELDMRAIQLKAFARTHPEVCERRPGYTKAYLARLLSEVF